MTQSLLAKIALGVLAIVLLWFLLTFVWIYYHYRQALVLIESTEPFERSGKSGQILVLGDSIAYGTGTTSPANSLAGKFAANFPDHSVTNLAKNGKTTTELAAEVQNLGDEKYDLILIVIGGNDIMHVSNDLDQTAKNLQTIYGYASAHSDNTVAISTGNFKYTSLFPWPLPIILSNRSVTVRDSAAEAASAHNNVHYIDMVEYNERESFTHVQEAPDRLHLSDEGVEYWMSAVKQATDNLNFEQQ